MVDRAMSALALAFGVSLAACVAPENPCDPAADPSARGTASLLGRVLDEEGAPVAGVSILVAGRGETTISQEDGAFVLEGLPPNEGEGGYELIAQPPAPLLGGRLMAPPLACREQLEGLVLQVARPPPAPEPEVVQATAPDRLLVAFASAAAGASAGAPRLASASCEAQASAPGLRYRVELRQPFGTWRPARLAQDPWDRATGGAAVASDLGAVDEGCARTVCDAFAYALPALDAEQARCAEVVGIEDPAAPFGTAPLEPYGRYQVRVVAEQALDASLVAQRLPAVLRSPDTAVPVDASLVPVGVMPVPLAPAEAADAEERALLDVECIVPIGEGRFAMLDNKDLRVIGEAEQVAEADYEDTEGLPEETLVLDEDTTAMARGELAGGRAAAILPAGRWLRVWKQLDAGGARVKKVFIGERTGQEPHMDPGVEPAFPLEALRARPGTFRGFSWLARPASSLAAYANAPDGYILLFEDGYVLLEREDPGRLREGLLARFMRPHIGAERPSYLEVERPGIGLAQRSFCTPIGDVTGAGEDDTGARVTAYCADLELALGREVDLRDLDILPFEPEATDATATFHVMLDAANGLAIALRTAHLVGDVQGLPVTEHMQLVPVGAEPVSAELSYRLSCESGEPTEEKQPVLLVANRASRSVSMLAVRDGPLPRVEQIAVVPLPSAPREFFMDPDGPSCEEPFSWVLAEDGQAFPIDMRTTRLDLPRCGLGACAAAPQAGHMRTGAVTRAQSGRARLLLGGRGGVAEVGFLRPERL